MCGMCGLLVGGNHWSNTISPVKGTNTRRQRLIHVALTNRLLASYRLRLDDFYGQLFVLSSPTGTSELVGDFASDPAYWLGVLPAGFMASHVSAWNNSCARS
jgi:hypothetical protein